MLPPVTQAALAVLACLVTSEQPTKVQVLELARMTHAGNDCLDKIVQILFERLAQPNLYHWREIEHTLIVIQQCSFIGSLGFVAFFKERVYAIAALANHQPGGSSVDPETVARVQRKARFLSQLLQNDERLQRARDKSIVISPAVSYDHVPVPLSIPQGAGNGQTQASRREFKTQNIVPPSPSAHLPTPESSPVRERPPVLEADDGGEKDVSDGPDTESDTSTLLEEPEDVIRTATENSPSEVTPDQLNEMANMTLEREPLGVLIGVLVERLVDEGQEGHRHLLKALKIINHCLIHGSEAFAAWFRANREMVANLCSFPVRAVQQFAGHVLKRLDKTGARRGEPSGKRRGPTSFARMDSHRHLSSSGSESESESKPPHEPIKDLTAFITTSGDHPIAGGGYSYVYKATLTIGSLTEVVAKKVLVLDGLSHGRLEKRWNREVRAWTQLSHPNIAILYGITHETNGSVGLVSTFFKHGHVMEYIKSLDKANVDVLKMMHGIASGVAYLHDKNVVHGDIKPNNIMVDDSGQVKIIDFGLSRVTGERGYTTSGPGITWAWAAPELLLESDDEPSSKSKASDVWAVAITFVQESPLWPSLLLRINPPARFQIMTGRPPYRNMGNYAILRVVRHGGFPERPSLDEECNFCPGDALWALLLCCWAEIPRDRPTIHTVRDEVGSLCDSA